MSTTDLKSKNEQIRQQNLICPILSIGAVRADSPIVGAAPQKSNLIACQREKCALWTPLMDEKGNLVAAGCALSFSVQAMLGLQNTMGVGVQLLAQALPKAATEQPNP